MMVFPNFNFSQWIYQNVYEKWDNIVRRPEKLVAMFTGYHANKATILKAMRNAGITEKWVNFMSLNSAQFFYFDI